MSKVIELVKSVILKIVGHKHNGLCGYYDCFEVQFNADDCYRRLVE